MKKILLNESERKAAILDREKAIVENFAKTFNKIKRLDENEVSEGPKILFPDWLITKLNDVHTKVGQGSIFAMDVNKVVEIAKQLVSKEQNIDKIANSTGTISANVNGVGYDLVLPIEKSKTLPNADITTTNKTEGQTTIEVPAVKTSANLQSFKTNQLTIIVRPMKNEGGEAIPNSYIILSVFPGNPSIPRISEWNGKYAVIIPDQQEQKQESIDESDFNHRGQGSTQFIIVPDDLGELNAEDFYYALESLGDGEMYERNFNPNQEYRVFVASQSGDEPTKEVTFRLKPNGDKLEVDASSMTIEVLDDDEINENDDDYGINPYEEQPDMNQIKGGLKIYGIEKNSMPYNFGPYTYAEAEAIVRKYQNGNANRDRYDINLYNDLRDMLPAIERMQTPKLDKNGKFEDVDSVGFSSGDLADY